MPLHPLLHEWDAALMGGDPLGFPGYAAATAGLESDAVTTGVATVDGASPAYALIESRFEVLGGSMGAAVGEKVVRAYRRATEMGLPVVVVAASGGARMQEGMVALAQLPRTAAAAAVHAAAGLLSVAVLRPPTTGGVLASYASLTDVRAAEPGATVGFAGPRIVELTTGVSVPADSHTAESAFANAQVDAVVAGPDQAAWVEAALGLADRPPPLRVPPGPPTGLDVAAGLCRSWVELRGRDPVVRAALATVAGRRAVVVATDRYATLNSAAPAGLQGRPGPDGFRLAQRAVALADRLGLPLVTFVDTPGADPSVTSEAGGIAGEIARTLAAMATVRSPTVAVCVAEGGSGGALALAHADRLLMMEHSVFYVIAPEAAASILRRDPADVEALGAEMKVSAADAVALGVADDVVGPSAAALEEAVTAALEIAIPGDRQRRLDDATARWIR